MVEPRKCVVRLRDLEGVEHAVQVSAGSLYEAACVGLHQFRRGGWSREGLGVLRSHGGRWQAVQDGEVHIDIAVIAAPTADYFGNADGSHGSRPVARWASRWPTQFTPTASSW